MAADELTLYNRNGVIITNARAVFGPNTYPLAELTLVRVGGGVVDHYVSLTAHGSTWTAYRSGDKAEIQSIVDALNAAKAGASPVSASGTKRCPYCAEEVQAAAIVCKHCGRNIAPAAIQAEKQKASSANLSALGGAIGQISCLLMLAGVVILTLPITLPILGAFLGLGK